MAGCPHVCARMGAEALREGALVLSVTTKPYAVALATVFALAIAGCTGDAEPTVTTSTTSPASSPTSTSQSTTGTGSSTTPNTTASTTATGTNIPPEARAKTADGAVAFTSYFVAEANAAYKQLTPERLSPLFLTSCKTCSAMTAQIKDYISRGEHLEGDFVTPTFVTIAQFDGGQAKTFMSTDTKATRVVDVHGSTVREVAPSKANGSIFLEFREGRWVLTDLKVAA
jgi:hypothetical protein